MKFIGIALLHATSVVLAGAQPHRHGHQHVHKAKRDPVPDPVADSVTLPGPIQIVYVLNGEPVPEAEVEEGIKNGTLIFADGNLSKAADTYVPPATPPKPPTYEAPKPSSTSQHAAPPAKATKPPSVAPPSYSPPSSGGGWGEGATGIDADFPDGEIPCSTFPSEYGAVPVDWLGLGGWTGIQCPGSLDPNGYSDILTVTAGGTCDKEGAFCSYACAAGYHKTQWPSTQGSTGQSVGGIQCKNGKLHLTNPGLSSKLCMKGAEQVQILVKNKLPKSVAVCGTDYPGLESETIPLDTRPGGTYNLTCPDAERYYKHQGDSTSAQYYVNPAGVPVDKACQWGSPDNPWGNFAPMNLGVGWSNGAAWLSIFQNAPTTDAKLEFRVEIQGDGISGTCKYADGQYCGGANYDQCSSTTGCTVSLSSGTATFVFS